MRTILIPVDFSENSNIAVAAAKNIASKTGAELIFLYAHQHYIADVGTMPISESATIYDQLENSLQHQLNEFVLQARNEGFEAEGIWETDSIHSAIIRHSSDLVADMIVVGRTGRGGFLDKLIGSSATDIALDAPCPVLVVPSQVTNIDFKRVVYATQLEFEEMANVREILAFTRKLGARLTFIKINSLEQANINDDQQYIRQITNDLNIPLDDIVIHRNGNVLEGIENHCDEVNADLLVVSNRERGFFEQFIINASLTKKLVVDTHIPLLVYHIY